jgi:hypothetical protein
MSIDWQEIADPPAATPPGARDRDPRGGDRPRKPARDPARIPMTRFVIY